MNNSYMNKKFVNFSGVFQKNMLLRNIKGIMYFVDGLMSLFIKKAKYKKDNKKKVLIVYNIALGDGVIFRCTALHLRELYPKDKYELTLICQKGLNKIYENDNVFDDIITIDYNKSVVNLKERFKNFKVLRNKYYDIVIDPVGISEWTTNIFYTRMALGKEKIGLMDTNLEIHCSKRKINKIYTKIVELKEKNLSLIEYYAKFFSKLENKKIDVGLEKLNIVPNKLDLPKKYYIIFPAASMKLKRWNIDKYVELSKKIYQKTKMKMVLLGTNSDKETMDIFKQKLDVPYIDLFNKTSLNDYFDVIANASLVVTNDTSAYHIAVVSEAPVALISGVYTYHRYMLYNFKRMNEFRKPLLIADKRKCMDCYNRCPYLKKDNENWPCLESITVDYAWKEIEKLINKK
ncbi:MAG: glycosyltransferase family 9 protein [Firmicutes bacterium]|nr:glycosyltransferase family 9 protein [Bacillota bacterium]